MTLEKSKKTLVLGNGQSRQNLKIENNYTIFGCNAVHRDIQVDYLICCDKRMVKEAIATKSFPIYTRRRWYKDFLNNEVYPLPDLPYEGSLREDDPFHWGSGPYAVLMAALYGQDVTLVGFDLYGIDKKVNNIYKDTVNYAPRDRSAVDPRYWIYQIGKVFQYFPHINFIVLNNDGWELPIQWKLNNVLLDKLPQRL